MKTILKHLILTFSVIVFVVVTSIPCLAVAESGSITVILEDKDKNQVNGTGVYLCQIAELNETGYYPVPDFEPSGISLSRVINNPDQSTAKSIAVYIQDNDIVAQSQVSENGMVTFSDLNLGIWLVYCDSMSDYTFNPYIVFLPYESDQKLYYDITTSPKVENNQPEQINIYVLKRWDDQNDAADKRPDSITVELLNGDQIVATAQLHDTNGWSHTFIGVAKDGSYSIREKAVEDYRTSYSGDATNGFLVINTYEGERLPQTGQYWWPIGLLTVVGVCFVLLGIFEIGAKKHDKKS